MSSPTLARSASAYSGPTALPGSVVFTSLPAGPQVREACRRARGPLGGDEGGRAVLVDTSTCAPRDAQALAVDLRARGWGSVDAPVSGGPTAARTGTLSVMAGGEPRGRR
jgi:3-hydroxyisobutyrate dehydrogenase-like beta-hydroxyacid dehydrogenase